MHFAILCTVNMLADYSLSSTGYKLFMVCQWYGDIPLVMCVQLKQHSVCSWASAEVLIKNETWLVPVSCTYKFYRLY